MNSNQRMELGLIATIFAGTAATVLGGLILLWIPPCSSANPNDKPLVIENKAAPPTTVPTPPSPDGERQRELQAWDREQQTLREQWAAQLEERDQALAAWKRECQTLRAQRDAEVEAMKRESRVLRDLLAAHKEQMNALTRQLDERNRLAASRIDSERNRPHSEPPSILLYYRVPRQITRQIPHTDFEETAAFLKRLHLIYRTGKPWKNSGLSPLHVPTLIDTATWQCYVARSEGHREQVRKKMMDLHIETSIDKPEDVDD